MRYDAKEKARTVIRGTGTLKGVITMRIGCPKEIKPQEGRVGLTRRV